MDSYQRVSYNNPGECKNIHELLNMLIQGWDTYTIINNSKYYTLIDIEDNYIIIRDDTNRPNIDVLKKPIEDFLRELHTGYSKAIREDVNIDFTRFWFKKYFSSKETSFDQPDVTVSHLKA